LSDRVIDSEARGVIFDGRRSDISEIDREVGNDLQDLGQSGAREATELGLAQVAYEGPKNLHPRPIRWSAFRVRAASPENRHTPLFRIRCHLFGQARFPDARFASQQKGCPAPGECPIDTRTKLSKLPRAAYKCGIACVLRQPSFLPTESVSEKTPGDVRTNVVSLPQCVTFAAFDSFVRKSSWVLNRA
jgi:hypothetical protein